MEFPEPKLIDVKRFYDDRGYFSEIWNKEEFLIHNIDLEFVQDNHSVSKKKGTVRGLHFQSPPFDQAKLIRCIKGSIFDVAVDIRSNSPLYGKVYSETLSETLGHQFFVPSGFAHGFMTLEDNTEVIYKCSNTYNKMSEGSINFNDPSINIKWPLPSEDIIASEKDLQAPMFMEFINPF